MSRRIVSVLLVVLAVVLIATCVHSCATLLEEKPSPQSGAEILSSVSCSDHGANLNQFIANAPTSDWFIYAFFDENGQKLVEYTYEDPYWVALPEAIFSYLLKYDNLTLVCSHPLLETGFRDVDLSFPLRKGLQSHIASMIVIDSHKIYYLEKDSEGDWPQSLAISDALKRLEDDPEFAGEVWTYVVDGTGMPQAYPSEEAIASLANSFGLEYRSENYFVAIDLPDETTTIS